MSVKRLTFQCGEAIDSIDRPTSRSIKTDDAAQSGKAINAINQHVVPSAGMDLSKPANNTRNSNAACVKVSFLCSWVRAIFTDVAE